MHCHSITKSSILLLIILSMTALFISSTTTAQNDNQLPHLNKQGATTQLMVDGNPFLILGGELGNSSFTSMEYVRPIWPRLKAMHLNAILAPVYWEIIGPEEGTFDFTIYDQLIAEARRYDLKLVLLWFGPWKNSMSSHAPAWVKLDQERFPRIHDENRVNQEILSAFSDNNLQADMAAFTALVQHIKETDSREHTVIIVQAGDNEFWMAGFGVVATFKNLENPDLTVGILKDEEGRFDNDEWQVIRHLNGYQPHQGRHVRIFYNNISYKGSSCIITNKIVNCSFVNQNNPGGLTDNVY